MSKPFVAIVMGSDSDLPVMEASFDVLRTFGVSFEARITSAHRTPEATKAYVQDAAQRGCAVFIAAAGMAAHLAGGDADLAWQPDEAAVYSHGAVPSRRHLTSSYVSDVQSLDRRLTDLDATHRALVGARR